MISASSAVFGGCLPDRGPPYVSVASASDSTKIVSALLADQSSTALGTARLPSIAGDVGRVEYDGDREKRIYLFTGDINAGVSTGDVLQLPLPAVPYPDSTAPTSVDITPFAPSQWMSLRAYDVGLCSAFPEDFFAPELFWQNVADGFARGLDTAFGNSLAAERIADTTFTPVLGDVGFYDTNGDRFRFSTAYHVPSVGGCEKVDLQISGEFGFVRDSAVISYPPQCLSPSDPSHTFVTNDGMTWDFYAVVNEVNVQASGDLCAVLGAVEARVEDSLRAGLPGAFNRAILDGLLVDPNLFDVPIEEIRPCTCDTECSELSPQGSLPYGPPSRRHRCKLTDPNPLTACGECWIQLDPDRINVRPEGIEVIVAEDMDDPQAPALSSGLISSVLCLPTRLSLIPGERPVRSALPGTLVVPIEEPPPSAPFCRREGR